MPDYLSPYPDVPGAMSAVYPTEGQWDPRLLPLLAAERRRRLRSSTGQPLTMVPTVLPPRPSASAGMEPFEARLAKARANLEAKKRGRQYAGGAVPPGFTIPFGSAGSQLGGTGPEDQFGVMNLPEAPAGAGAVEGGVLGGVAEPIAREAGGVAGGLGPVFGPRAEARQALLQNARTGGLGLTSGAEARLAGVPERTVNYAQRLAENRIAARTKIHETAARKKLARELRMQGPGPRMMQQMEKRAGQNGGQAGGPEFLPLGFARNPQEAALVNQHNAAVMEYRARTAAAGAEKARWEGQRAEKLDLAWGQARAQHRAALDQAYPDRSPEWKDAEAKKQADADVPSAAPARGAGPSMMPETPRGGIAPQGMTTGGALSVEDYPRKGVGGNLYDFALLFPEGTPPEVIKESARRKGYTDQDIKVALEEPQTNFGSVFGSAGMSRQIKAVERLSGKKVGAGRRVMAHALQGVPLIGPMASGLAGELVPGSFWFD